MDQRARVSPQRNPRIVLPVLACPALPAPAGAVEWTGWRGPPCNGAGTDAGGRLYPRGRDRPYCHNLRAASAP